MSEKKPCPPYLIAVCGASCSGKTTIAAALAEELNKIPEGGQPAQSQAEPPAIIHGDHFFIFDQYRTDSCPLQEVNGRIWKDWESITSIDWEEYLAGVAKAKAEPHCPKYLVVEGFLLLATPESRALFDVIIDLRIQKEECWQRRRARALSMRHLPVGFSDGEEERNYEVLQTYVKSDADQAAISREAADRYPKEGDLAWLRLYFEEVLWPASVQQMEEASKLSPSDVPVLSIDAQMPPDKDAWNKAHVPSCLAFVRRHLGADPPATAPKP